jgi:glycerate 2-kinase
MLDLKQAALQIFRKTLAAIDIPSAMQRKLDRVSSQILVAGKRLDLRQFDRMHVVAIGKASVAMARGLAGTISPEFRVGGIVVAPSPFALLPEGFELIVAGHPVPNEGSFAAGRAVLDSLSGLSERALVFFLLSGGGSSLVEWPLEPHITLEDMQALHHALVTCGASIDEINAVRKHLSAVKGGRLAIAAGPATKITLAITDVPDGKESALASGPTLPDPTTVAHAREVIRRYDLLLKLPPSIRTLFEHPEFIPETPKPSDPAFGQRRNAFEILLGRHDLFHAAHHASESMECITICDNTTDDWHVAKAVDFLLAQLDALKKDNPSKSVAVIADGELSSPVTGDGMGGRNQAFVLDAVRKIAGRKIAVLSAGTDGIDGSSPAAGAVADGTTFARGQSLGLDPGDYFQRCDSYHFFRALGDAIETGPTGNNLRDLRVLLAE